jgi:anti-sigma regulatory factor (Ser/Thr protein kinase)
VHAVPCHSVEVRASIEDGAVVVDIADTGRWDGTELGRDGGGLGLLLIRHLIDHVELHPSPNGTTVRLRHSLYG